ncbi:hypothetical protein BBO99_00006004 [Phytophthora kernoviae]|uniref:Uncharacterized protein n=2 Tax=Phytophthora kernoviae TaxID=325452 RepID=A0A421F678_9STRA|nr:hypothetical protein G195_007192 [Phytophthora kernoviae 00238/432]KAG2527364.1 hypothetical protein JM16_003485 [Phytophthora kernoviae]KAG2528673.1 hypothetical protein JM18_003204 [Phytophthora kernoviae]RLN26262.1 hypothetical protein BBI17_006075 [Phytophthora kernoviae]RLN78381.1 hypothetical protein BBO99_00006004 [Phytophthora kernoviae]
MTPDMTDGTTRGIDAFMEKWKLVSLCHGDINIRIIHLALDAGGSLVATTKGIHVINESTQLEVQGSVRFEWDANLGRVASVLCKADLLTPLLALLGNLEDVSRVFSNALVTPECNLDPGQDFPTIY